jgi:hypothetical protein
VGFEVFISLCGQCGFLIRFKNLFFVHSAQPRAFVQIIDRVPTEKWWLCSVELIQASGNSFRLSVPWSTDRLDMLAQTFARKTETQALDTSKVQIVYLTTKIDSSLYHT